MTQDESLGRILAENGRYRAETASPIGKPFTIPEPVSLTIETTAYPSPPDE